MKKQLLLSLIALFFGTFLAFSQTNLSCGEMFTDPEGPNLNYANNSNVTTTIYPNLPSELVVVNFNSFSLEDNIDFLSVYDGPSVNSPLLGTYTGTNIPQQIIASGFNGIGCLTFVFTSNDTVTSTGWEANTFCFPNPNCPQAIGLNLSSNVDGSPASLFWSSTGSLNANWQVVISPLTPNLIITTDQPFLDLSNLNLQPGTYTATVSALCNGIMGIGQTISFTVAPLACPAPSQTNITILSQNSAQIEWIETGTATDWEVLVLDCGSTPTPNDIGVATTSNPYILTNLDPNGCYQIHVRSLCTAPLRSEWSAPAFIDTIPNMCQMPNNLAGQPIDNTSFLMSWIESGSATSWEVLALPCGITPTPNNIGTIVTTNTYLFTNLTPSTCYNFYVKSICDATSTSDWSSITYQPQIICPPITSMGASTLSSTSAVFQWTNSSNATSWQVIALPCGTTPNANTVGTTVTTPSYTFTNLTPSTCYSLYVRAICSTTSISEWSTASNIITPANPNTTPICGGIFLDSGGSTGNYANNENTTTTICPSTPGDLVTVTFTAFNTEANWDALYVFNGNSIASPQIVSTNGAGSVPGGLAGGYWGTTIPGPFTSSSSDGCLTFRFRSDTSGIYAGWIANVTCTPAPTCPKPTALITSNITSSSVTLGWTNNSSATNFEVIALPCGSPAPTATTIGAIATSSNPYTFTGLNSSTCYTFYARALCSTNDVSTWSSSINATTLQATPICGGTFVDNGGTAANYANSSDNTYTICPTNPGEIVTVTFTSFDTEVNYDGLYVFDGNSITAPQIASSNPAANVPGSLPGAFWGTSIPGPFTSSDPSGCLTFRFRSDTTVNKTGWLANITCESTSTTCPKPTSLTATNITSTSITVGWTNNSNATSFEVIALPCGTSPTATTTGMIATSSNQYTFNNLTSSTCYSFYVRALCSANDFSAWSTAITGMTLIAPPACGGTFVDNGGLTANYANSSDNTYTICPAIPGEVVTVTFTSFDTEATWDGLYVFDGNSINATQIASTNLAANVPGGLPGAFWGTAIPGPFTSSDPTGCLTFRFRSDTSVNRAGWNANVTCGLAPDKITLIAFVDANNNGIKDAGETNFSNGSFVYQINDSGTNTDATSTNGIYSITDTIPTDSYDFTYEISNDYTAYFSSGTTTYNNITVPVGSGNTILYFPITVVQNFSDVSITIIPFNAPRPGMTYTNKIVYKNLGIASASGTITFVKPALTTVNTISQTGTIGNLNGFIYDYTNLLPNESRTITVTLNVPTSPTVNLNNILTDSASITSTTVDINSNNNNTSNSQIVVNSFDPNDKMESRGDKIPINQFTQDDYLFYTIRFENEGTANAIDIRIEDDLSTRIDPESIRMVGSSHNCVMKKDVNSNHVVWEFENIQLVPTSVNADLGKGYVMFKVKLNPGFVVGTIVSNTANIYFDSNPAIVTNTFNTKFTGALSNVSFDSNNFVVYPNPANTFVQVKLQNTSENIESISLTDLLGKTVKTINSVSSNNTTLDISDVAKGVYMIEITTDSKLKQIKKLVIE